MPSIAHNAAVSPSSEKAPPPKSSEAPRSWVFARRAEGDSPISEGETVGTEIRTQAAWLGLVLQQKIQRYGKEIGGSIDIEEVITRLLDASLEADGIESDYRRLAHAEVARLERKAAKVIPHKAKPFSKTKEPAPASSVPGSGMKPRTRWFDDAPDNSESVGEAMRRQVSALAATYRQRVREDGVGSENWDIESGFARLMALSLEIEDLEHGASLRMKLEAEIKELKSELGGPDPAAPTNPAPITSDALAEEVLENFAWPCSLTGAQVVLVSTTLRKAAHHGVTSREGFRMLLTGLVDVVLSDAMLPREPADETLGKAIRRQLGSVTSAVTLKWGTEGAKAEILAAAGVLMKLSRVADEIDGVSEDEEAPPTSDMPAVASTDNDDATSARIAARQAAETADLDEVRTEYDELACEVESLNPSDKDVPLSTLILGAVGHYPGAPLFSLVEEVKVRTRTLSRLARTATDSTSGIDREDALESLTSELTSLAHKAETAFVLLQRLGLGWKVA